MTPFIEIYGTPSCLWCNKAKDLISTYGLVYNDYHVGKDITPMEFREIFPGFTKVPQIKINGQHIGGYDELVKYLEETSNGFGEQSL
jgi:glutaredoxin